MPRLSGNRGDPFEVRTVAVKRLRLGERRRGLGGDLVGGPGSNSNNAQTPDHGAFSQPGTNTIAK